MPDTASSEGEAFLSFGLVYCDVALQQEAGSKDALRTSVCMRGEGGGMQPRNGTLDTGYAKRTPLTTASAAFFRFVLLWNFGMSCLGLVCCGAVDHWGLCYTAHYPVSHPGQG